MAGEKAIKSCNKNFKYIYAKYKMAETSMKIENLQFHFPSSSQPELIRRRKKRYNWLVSNLIFHKKSVLIKKVSSIKVNHESQYIGIMIINMYV